MLQGVFYSIAADLGLGWDWNASSRFKAPASLCIGEEGGARRSFLFEFDQGGPKNAPSHFKPMSSNGAPESRWCSGEPTVLRRADGAPKSRWCSEELRGCQACCSVAVKHAAPSTPSVSSMLLCRGAGDRDSRGLLPLGPCPGSVGMWGSRLSPSPCPLGGVLGFAPRHRRILNPKP